MLYLNQYSITYCLGLYDKSQFVLAGRAGQFWILSGGQKTPNTAHYTIFALIELKEDETETFTKIMAIIAMQVRKF